MNPYELRFSVFELARSYVEQKYHSDFEIFQIDRESNPESKIPYPTFPSFDEIELLAERINKFVSTQ